jgi:hypothetical protein
MVLPADRTRQSHKSQHGRKPGSNVARSGAQAPLSDSYSRLMEFSAVVSAIVVDCSDPSNIANFWQALLGGRTIEYPELNVVALRAPGITFDFCRNNDPKVAKNRWHLDLATDDASGTVERALALGAARADDFGADDNFVVMRDPEGNEFCVLRGTPAGAPWAPPPKAKP